ncbi:MAG: DUF3786 domain-containing protein [Candidatus Caldarchaeum sp.]|nr:DUF3786 domain-containing protein [Candidatus Caldarchaeum sp.]
MIQPESPLQAVRKQVNELFERLGRVDHSAVMKRCDVVYLSSQGSGLGRYIVNVLNKTYTVELDSGKVVDLTNGRDAGEKLSYVVLEYLTSEGSSGSHEGWQSLEATLTQLSHRSYYQKTVVRPLEKLFGYNAELFEEVSKRLTGKKEKLGGTAYSFIFLPKARALIQLWVGKASEFTKPKINTSFNTGARGFLKETALLYAFETMVEFMEKEVKRMRKT